MAATILTYSFTAFIWQGSENEKKLINVCLCSETVWHGKQ